MIHFTCMICVIYACCMYIYVYMYVHIHTHTYMYVHIHTHAYRYIYTSATRAACGFAALGAAFVFGGKHHVAAAAVTPNVARAAKNVLIQAQARGMCACEAAEDARRRAANRVGDGLAQDLDGARLGLLAQAVCHARAPCVEVIRLVAHCNVKFSGQDDKGRGVLCAPSCS